MPQSRLDKKYVTAYSNFSAFLLGKGAYAEAEMAVRRAISLQPNNAQAYNHLAKILHHAPISKLIIKSQALDHETVYREFAARMATAGIKQDRFELLGGNPQP